MRKRLVNHKILSVNDCLIIVSNLFISIVTTNNDSPSFLLRVSTEAMMPQKGMAWKAAEKTRGNGNPLLRQSLREVVFTKTPPSTLANSNFPLLEWFFLINDNTAMYPYCERTLTVEVCLQQSYCEKTTSPCLKERLQDWQTTFLSPLKRMGFSQILHLKFSNYFTNWDYPKIKKKIYIYIYDSIKNLSKHMYLALKDVESWAWSQEVVTWLCP